MASAAGPVDVARSYNSRDPNAGSGGPLGAPWVLSLPGQDLGYQSLAVGAGRVTVYDSDNQPIVFYGTTVFTPEAGAESLTLAKVGSTYTLTELDGTVTTFTLAAGSATDYRPTRIASPATASSVSYAYAVVNGVTRPSVATGPVPSGVDCTVALASRDHRCRTLEFSYTTGGRLDFVDLVAYESLYGQAAGWTTTKVAQYDYDGNGRLLDVYDPRISPNLKTVYGYDANGRVTTVTPPGVQPWSIGYGTIPTDSDPGRVLSVAQTGPNGTATTSFVYNVGLASPYAMNPSDVAGWAQTDVPTDATAVFPADEVPANPPADYNRATVYYLDRNGAPVNVAEPGANITTTEYDTTASGVAGNVVRTLSAANRARALAAGAGSAALAVKIDSQTKYASNNLDVSDTYGPLRQVTLADGSVVAARAHTSYVYDENQPAGACNSGPCHLVTTKTDGVLVDGESTDRETRVTKYGYNDDPANPDSGWTLRQATSTTTDAVSGGLNLTTLTFSDPATGNETQRTLPKGTAAGNDAYTTRKLYYSADASAADPDCRNRPEYAGLACKTAPGGQPTTGPTIPTAWTTNYDRYWNPTRTLETSGSDTRTTVTGYDAAGRTVLSSQSATVGAALADVTTTYDPVTGQVAATSDGSGTISRAYDSIGRLASYQDADGNTTSYGYDILGNVVSRLDAKSLILYAYDTSIDARGLQTLSVDYATSASVATTYDPDGQPLTDLRQRAGTHERLRRDRRAGPGVLGRVADLLLE